MRTCAARTFVKISSALWSTRILTLPRRTESWRNASSALLTTSVLEDLHSLRRSGAQCPHVPDRRTGSIQAYARVHAGVSHRAAVCGCGVGRCCRIAAARIHLRCCVGAALTEAKRVRVYLVGHVCVGWCCVPREAHCSSDSISCSTELAELGCLAGAGVPVAELAAAEPAAKQPRIAAVFARTSSDSDVRQRCTKRSCALHRPRMNFAWTSPSRLCSKSLPHKPCVRACVQTCGDACRQACSLPMTDATLEAATGVA